MTVNFNKNPVRRGGAMSVGNCRLGIPSDAWVVPGWWGRGGADAAVFTADYIAH